MEYEIKVTTHYPGPDEVPEDAIKDTLEYIQEAVEKYTRLLTRTLMLHQLGSSKGWEIITRLTTAFNDLSKELDEAWEEYYKKAKEN